MLQSTCDCLYLPVYLSEQEMGLYTMPPGLCLEAEPASPGAILYASTIGRWGLMARLHVCQVQPRYTVCIQWLA